MSKKECRWCSPDWTKNKKIYKYKGHYYCEDCLLREVEFSIGEDFSTVDTTAYYINGEYIGNDNELGVEDVIQELIDYGCDIVEVDETKRKVFSLKKYNEWLCTTNGLWSKEEAEEIINDPKHWSKKCEGLTSEEMMGLWIGTMDEWMIEVDDEKESIQ